MRTHHGDARRTRQRSARGRAFKCVAAVVFAALSSASSVALAADSALAAPPTSPSIGVSPGGPFMWLSDANLHRELGVMRSAGAGRLRIDVDWSAVESRPGVLDWTNTDRVVRAAERHGLQVLGIVTYSPRWAQAASVPAGTTHGAPADPAVFARFASRAAARYAGRITTWEVWNEPNLSTFWAPRPNASAYGRLLVATAAAIRASAPGAAVLTGGLAPATDKADGSQISPVTFVSRLYVSGAAKTADAVAVHPYSFPAMPTDTSTSSWNTFVRLGLIHAIMTKGGDQHKKIWLTEFGAPTGTSSVAVSEQTQARMLASGLAKARRLTWVGPLFIYNGRDSGADAANPEHNFGIVRRNFSAKPAFAAVRAQATLNMSTRVQPLPRILASLTDSPPAAAAASAPQALRPVQYGSRGRVVAQLQRKLHVRATG